MRTVKTSKLNQIHLNPIHEFLTRSRFLKTALKSGTRGLLLTFCFQPVWLLATDAPMITKGTLQITARTLQCFWTLAWTIRNCAPNDRPMQSSAQKTMVAVCFGVLNSYLIILEWLYLKSLFNIYLIFGGK
ncbi:Hypothetical_protein [Hexamita inflata]|uniref:Hypothetical_protein n=1 Tax=Hexamita inflata TaxID=28002 RepID=A0AA86NUK8_9EUKA|nr:Hypothetical protein HINF_LOCUS13729 [Hexamita inflata]